MSSSEITAQIDIDQANKAFWDELCGSMDARSLGIDDRSPQSLKRFDDWYMDFYPYLTRYIPFRSMKGKRVLEVGLGYGTVAQRLIEHGADYHGLDIAANPVAMVRHRLRLLNREGTVKQGSVLDCPFENDAFDWVISIGCLHCTGNLALGIKELHRVLKPGGQGLLMVYNATSHRHWFSAPLRALKQTLDRRQRYSGVGEPRAHIRALYDANLDGVAAPHTEFVTAHQLKTLCSDFRTCRVHKENIATEGPFKFLSRPRALRFFGPFLGLDLYCQVEK